MGRSRKVLWGIARLVTRPAVVASGVLCVALLLCAIGWRERELYVAADAGDADRVRRLLAWGARGSYATSEGVSALHAAAGGGDSEVVQLLLKAGMDPDVVDEDGNTPLHDAARRAPRQVSEWDKRTGHHGAVAELLLEAGGKVDARNKWGDTPLMFAAVDRNVEVAVVLLGSGADLQARDENEITPAWVGRVWLQKDVLPLLEDQLRRRLLREIEEAEARFDARFGLDSDVLLRARELVDYLDGAVIQPPEAWFRSGSWDNPILNHEKE